MKRNLFSGWFLFVLSLWMLTPSCAIAQNPARGSISGKVWKDANNNGQRDAGEMGIGGVKIELYKMGNLGFSSYVTTNADGTYKIPDLQEGQYRLQILRYYLPDNCQFSRTNSSVSVPDSVNNDFDAGGLTRLIHVNPDSSTKAISFIDAALTYRPTPEWGSVEGTFWYDKNDNGIRESDEQGVKGVVVEIGSINYNGYFAYDTTDENGRYGFSRLPSLFFDLRIVDTSLPDSLRVSSNRFVRMAGGNETNDSDFSVNYHSAFFEVPYNSSNKNVKFIDAALVAHPLGAKQYDLSIERSISKKLMMLNDTFSYSIRIRNEGRSTTHQVKVTDHVVDINHAGYHLRNNTIPVGVEGTIFIWTPNTLFPGALLEYKIEATAVLPGIWHNIAEITSMVEEDSDSTPNNNAAGEDDIASACFSVPYLFKKGEGSNATFRLPSRFSGVVWQRKAPDGTITQAGTGNTLVVAENEPGTYAYTFTYTSGTCPAEGCCPGYVIVQENCPQSLCIPVTTLRRKI